jgi:hypothetical protein
VNSKGNKIRAEIIKTIVPASSLIVLFFGGSFIATYFYTLYIILSAIALQLHFFLFDVSRATTKRTSFRALNLTRTVSNFDVSESRAVVARVLIDYGDGCDRPELPNKISSFMK